MPWDLKENRIAAVKYMHPKIQSKATEIANAILREGNTDEGQAIAIGIKKAKQMFEKQAMIQSGLRTDIPSVFSGKQIGARNDIPLAKGLMKYKSGGIVKLAYHKNKKAFNDFSSVERKLEESYGIPYRDLQKQNLNSLSNHINGGALIGGGLGTGVGYLLNRKASLPVKAIKMILHGIGGGLTGGLIAGIRKRSKIAKKIHSEHPEFNELINSASDKFIALHKKYPNYEYEYDDVNYTK